MEKVVSIIPVFDRRKTNNALKPVELYIYKKNVIRNYIRINLETLAWDKKRNRPKNLTDAFKMDTSIKEVSMFCHHMATQGQAYIKRDIENYLDGKNLINVFNFYQLYIILLKMIPLNVSRTNFYY